MTIAGARTFPAVSPGDRTVDPRQLVRGLRDHWPWALLPVLVVAAALLTAGALLPPRYRARGVVEVGISTDRDPTRQSHDGGLDRALAHTHQELIGSDRVLDEALGLLGKPPSPAERLGLLQRISIEPDPGTYLLEVACEGRSPESAAQTAAAIMEAWLPEAERLLGSQAAERDELRARERELLASLERARANSLEVGLPPRDRLDSLKARAAALGAHMAANQVAADALVQERRRIVRALEHASTSPDLVELLSVAGPEGEREARAQTRDGLQARLALVRQRGSGLDAEEEHALVARIERERVAAQGALVRLAKARIRTLGEDFELLGARLRVARVAQQEVAVARAALAGELPLQERSAELVTWLTAQLREARRELRLLGQGDLPRGASIVQAAEPPSAAERPISPPAGIGALILAALFGGLVALARERHLGVLRSAAELPHEVEVLARLPPLETLQISLAQHLLESPGLHDEFTAAAARVSGCLHGDRRLLVTGGSGQDLVAFGLAMAWGKGRGQRTLLALSEFPGWGETLLQGPRRMPGGSPGLRTTSLRGVDVLLLAGGAGLAETPELNDARYAHVVLSLPLADERARRLLGEGAATLLAGRIDHTRRADAIAARRAVDAAGGRCLGFALLDAAFTAPGSALTPSPDTQPRRPSAIPTGEDVERTDHASSRGRGGLPINGGLPPTLAEQGPALWERPQAIQAEARDEVPAAGSTTSYERLRGLMEEVRASSGAGVEEGAERMERLERRLARLLRESKRTDDPDELEGRVRELVEEALGAASSPEGGEQGRPDARYDLLDRRMVKLSGAVESLEQALAVVAATGGDTGLPSIFDSVQGLAEEDDLREHKGGLLRAIYEENLVLQR